MEVNVGKTEKMYIGGEQQNTSLEGGRIIQCCEEYKYLEL